MRYGFINNFSQALAADLAAGATTLTLDGGGADLSAASATLVYTLTLDDGNGATEIVHVTGQATNDLTIVRAQEGTTAQAWTTGTTVEMRVTAGSLGVMLMSEPGGNARGANVMEWQATRSSADQVAAGADSILIGNNTKGVGDSSVVIGQDAQLLDGSTGYGHILIAPDSTGISAGSGSCIFIGTDLWTSYQTYGALCIGYNIFPGTGNNTMFYGVVVGYDNYLRDSCGPRGTVLGHRNDTANSENLTIVGDANTIQDAGRGLAVGTENLIAGSSATFSDFDRCVAVGHYNDLSGIALGVAIGNGISDLKTGTKKISGLSYLQNPTHYPSAFSTSTSDNEPDFYRWAGEQVVLATKDIDLSVGTDEQVFTLPADVHFFIDEIDIIVVAASTPGGSPSIDVGISGATPANVLSSEAVTVNTVAARQKASPLTIDGQNTLRVGVNTAGTGTWLVRVVLKGLAMEM